MQYTKVGSCPLEIKKSFGLKEAKEFAKKSKAKSDEFELENLLIMVDGEGDLSNEGMKKE